MLDSWLSDLRLALRSLVRSPGHALVVVATSAVGIAAVAVILGVFSPYFLRPLPFAEPERLLHLGRVDPETGWDGVRFSGPQLRDLKDAATSFEELGAYYYGTVNLTGGDVRPERIMAARMTGEAFSVLGAPALEGRTLRSDDVGRDVVVVSETLWRSRWGGAPGLVGSTIRIDDTAFEVVGILPTAFGFPFNEVRLWRPFDPGEAFAERSQDSILVFGRLADGVSAAAARAELESLHRGWAAEYPDVDGRSAGIVAKDLRATLNFAWEPLRISFVVLSGAVGALLLLACVNIANLVLARGLARQRDMAVRSALGARATEVARPLFLESLVLALLGGAAGLASARAGLAVIAPFVPDGLFRVGDPALDATVLRGTLLAILVTPLVFGLLPAWTTGRAALAGVLRDGGRGGSGRGASRSRRALVVAQVTLAVLLAAGAGLMARSLIALQSVETGFRTTSVLTAEVSPPTSRYADPESLDAFAARAEEELRGAPGVVAVGTASHLPLNHETFSVRVADAGSTLPPEERPRGLTSRVSGSWFEAMGIPVVAGRSFRAEDAGSDAVLVSRSFAERLWPEGDPIGRSVAWTAGTADRTGRVVGVVGDVRFEGLVGGPRGHLYAPLEGSGVRRRFFVAAVAGTAGGGEAARRTVEGAFAGVDPLLPVTVRPMAEVVRESTLQWSVSSVFLGVFGSLAILLAGLGIAGVVSWSVRLRRREIGIRMALGASRNGVVRGVVNEGLRLVGWGIGLGSLALLALSPILSSVVYGVGALDPVTLVGVAIALALTAVVAAAAPARDAAAVAPASVLRDD